MTSRGSRVHDVYHSVYIWRAVPYVQYACVFTDVRGSQFFPSYTETKRILTTIGSRESSGGNCRQLFPKSLTVALAFVYVRHCTNANKRPTLAYTVATTTCESLDTITAITAAVASHRYRQLHCKATPFPRPLLCPSSLHPLRKKTAVPEHSDPTPKNRRSCFLVRLIVKNFFLHFNLYCTPPLKFEIISFPVFLTLFYSPWRHTYYRTFWTLAS